MSGKVERELTVQIKPEALQAAGVGVAQVVQALQLQNLAAPVGRVTGALDERSIRLKGASSARRSSRSSSSPSETVSSSAWVRSPTCSTVPRKQRAPLALYNEPREAVGIDVKKSKGYSTTTVADEILARIDSHQEPRFRRARRIDVVKNAANAFADSVANVEEALLEGALLTVLVVFLFLNSWRSTVITGLALPVSVLASVHRRVGVRLHARDDVAARPLARDRHPDRRRDRGAREHRATRGDGERPLHGGARGHRRDRARRRRDDVLDPRRVRADRVHAGRGRSVVQAVRAHHCRARCSCRCSSRSRSTRCSRRTGPIRTRRSTRRRGSRRQLDKFNHWFNRQAQNYKHVIAWALDHRRPWSVIAIGTFFGSFVLPAKGLTGTWPWCCSPWRLAVIAWFGVRAVVPATGERLSSADRDRGDRPRRPCPACGHRRLRLLPGGRPGRVHRADRDAAGLEPRVHAAQGRRSRASACARPRKCGTPTRRSAAAPPGAVDVGEHLRRMVPKDERDRERRADLGARCASQLKTIGRSDGRRVRDRLGRRAQAGAARRCAATTPTSSRSTPTVRSPRCRRFRAPSTWRCRRKGQKPELNGRAQSRRRRLLGVTVGQVAQSLRPAFAGIDAGDWQDPSGETRDVIRAAGAGSATSRGGSAPAAARDSRDRTASRRRCRSARWRRSRRALARR